MSVSYHHLTSDSRTQWRGTRDISYFLLVCRLAGWRVGSGLLLVSAKLQASRGGCTGLGGPGWDRHVVFQQEGLGSSSGRRQTPRGRRWKRARPLKARLCHSPGDVGEQIRWWGEDSSTSREGLPSHVSRA